LKIQCNSICCLQPEPAALVGLAKLWHSRGVARGSRAARKVWAVKVEGKGRGHRGRTQESEEESGRLHGCRWLLMIKSPESGKRVSVRLAQIWLEDSINSGRMKNVKMCTKSHES